MPSLSEILEMECHVSAFRQRRRKSDFKATWLEDPILPFDYSSHLEHFRKPQIFIHNDCPFV